MSSLTDYFDADSLQNKVDGRYIPEHIPWEFEEDVFTPMPWIPEGSLVSKNMFYEVRQAQRPKSYSPPPTPPAGHDVPPLDSLPFPAIIPLSAEGPTLKRAASFHPGGSQRLRREALVIDGKVTIDMGFKMRSRSCESIVPSSSEQTNIIRQLDDGHQSGLERLKNSMLRLMKVQSQWRHSMVAKAGKPSEVSFSTVAPNKTKEKTAKGTSHEPLAVRRGLPVPSTLKSTSTHSLPPVSPYHPDIPTPFRGSPSAATPLVTRFLPTSAACKRESIGIEDMCTNLRSLVSPVIFKPAGTEEITSSHSSHSATDPMNASDDAMDETPRTPIEDWNFGSKLEGVHGGDPFSYFDGQERMPSFIRPFSIIPDIVTENTETQRCSGSSATSVSTFPEPPIDNLAGPLIPYITVSGSGPIAEHLRAGARLSFSSPSIASNEGLVDSEDSDGMGACVVQVVDSTDTSPRSSGDKDEPLAIRRLTLLARSSAVIPIDDESSPSGCSISLAQGTLKPAAKIVRFAPKTEERTYLADPIDTHSPPDCQRPRSSSAPPPQKCSLRNQTFPQRGECKDGRLSSSQPITFPSRIPKKRTFGRVGLSHMVTDQKSTETLSLGGRDGLTLPELEHTGEARKRLSSLTPVPGLKPSSALSSLTSESADDGKRATGRNSRLYVSLKQPSRTPTPQSAPPQQKAPLATSWSMTLRQYVKGGDTSSEKRQVPYSTSPRPHGFLPVSPVGKKDDRKSSLPVKKASFFRDGVGKATTVSKVRDRTEVQGRSVGRDDGAEGKVIGSVDKTGGISYIAPPKVRATPQPRGRVKGETQSHLTAGTKTLRPVQIRNLLGRLAA